MKKLLDRNMQNCIAVEHLPWPIAKSDLEVFGAASPRHCSRLGIFATLLPVSLGAPFARPDVTGIGLVVSVARQPQAPF